MFTPEFSIYHSFPNLVVLLEDLLKWRETLIGCLLEYGHCHRFSFIQCQIGQVGSQFISDYIL